MKIALILVFLLVFGIGVGFSSMAYAQDIPAWVKGVADWWVKGNISDDEFLEAIEFLIKEDFISIEDKLPANNDAQKESYTPNESKIKNDGSNYNDDYDNYDEWNGAEFTMSPQDCYDFEKYDYDEKFCYSECETDEECEKLDKLISSHADDIWDDSSDMYDDISNERPEQNSDDEQNYNDSEELLASYNVSGNQITATTDNVSQSSKYLTLQKDIKKHNELWSIFAKLIPLENRKDVSTFNVFTDGVGGLLAAVAGGENDNQWVLEIDIADAYKNNKLDKKEVVFSLIHEYAHILTLDVTQTSISSGTCTNFVTDDLCTKTNSYMNKFFQEFWTEIYAEHTKIQNIESDEEYYEAIDKFVSQHQDKFITDYASASPEEDIAESFTAFVLKDKPVKNTIQDRKILFFYDFVEIVELRDFIRNNL